MDRTGAPPELDRVEVGLQQRPVEAPYERLVGVHQ
jgi:hypothetical protein